MLKYPSVLEIKSVYTSFPELRVNTQTAALVHIGNAPGFVRIFFACLKHHLFCDSGRMVSEITNFDFSN